LLVLNACHPERSRRTCGCLFLNFSTSEPAGYPHHSHSPASRATIEPCPAALFHIHSSQPQPHALHRRHQRPNKLMFQHKWKEFSGFTETTTATASFWFETYQEIDKAIARRKQLKGWRREKKIALIEKQTPHGRTLESRLVRPGARDQKRAGRPSNLLGPFGLPRNDCHLSEVEDLRLLV